MLLDRFFKRGAVPTPLTSTIASPRLLDSLRGLAAFAVLFTHVFSLAMPPEAMPTWLDQTPLRVVHTGRAPVVFFFVLSGYVLALSLLKEGAPGLVTFALRRSARLLLPVAGAVLLSAALCALLNRGPILNGGWDVRDLWSEPLGPWMMLRQMLLLGGDGWFTLDIPLWTLVHEWRLSVLVPLVLLFRRQPVLLVALAFLAHLLAIALGVEPNLHQLGPHLVSTVLSTSYFALAFAAGAALAMGGGRLRLAGAARWVAWTCILVTAALPFDLGVIAASTVLIVLARGPGALPRVLAAWPLLRLGRISFSLYLIHMPVLAALIHATHGTLPPWEAAAIGVPVALLAAAGFHALGEAPAHRLSRWIGANAVLRKDKLIAAPL